LWLSESGLPGFNDVQDLIDFLPDEEDILIQTIYLLLDFLYNQNTKQ